MQDTAATNPWKRGDFAKANGKLGKITMEPDSDGDVKLQWLDGATSPYIKAATLSRPTKTEIEAAVQAARPFTHHLHAHQLQLSSRDASWRCDGCRAPARGARYRCVSGCDFDLCDSCKSARAAPTWKRGDFAKVNGKVGKLTMAPDGDGDVKLEWPDGEVSGYIKAAKLTRATRGEARAAAAAAEEAFAEPSTGEVVVR